MIIRPGGERPHKLISECGNPYSPVKRKSRMLVDRKAVMADRRRARGLEAYEY